MSKFLVLYWTRLFIDNGRQTSLHTGGGQPDQKKMFAQWFDERPKGPPGLLNKLRCEDYFDVPKDTIQPGGKEFIYCSKSN